MSPELVKKIMDQLLADRVLSNTNTTQAIKAALEKGDIRLAQHLINDPYRLSNANTAAPSLREMLSKEGFGEKEAREKYNYLKQISGWGVPEWEQGKAMPAIPPEFAQIYSDWAQMYRDTTGDSSAFPLFNFVQNKPPPRYRPIMAQNNTGAPSAAIAQPSLMFPQGLGAQATASDQIRHALSSVLTRTPHVYQGKLQAPLGPTFEKAESTAAMLAREALINAQNDPSSEIHKATIKKGMDEKDLAPFDKGMGGFSTDDIAKIVAERGLSKNYVDEAANAASRIFDAEIAPGISGRYAGQGRTFDSSSRLAAIENARSKFVDQARLRAQQEHKEIQRSEMSEALKQLMASREQSMAASSNKQGALNQAFDRQNQASNALAANQRHHMGSQAEMLGNEVKLAGIRTQHQNQDLQNQYAQWKEQENHPVQALNTAVGVNQGLLAPLPHQVHMPYPVAPNPAANLGITAASLLGHNPNSNPQQAAIGGLIRGYAEGGAVHLPPNYSEGQLGMQDEEVLRERQLGEELANRPSQANRGYWSNMAKMFSKPGPEAYANAIADAHNAMSAEEDKPYAGKLASAEIMGRIHKSRQDQKKALMEYHRLTDKDLWERAHKSKELALETEKVRGTLGVNALKSVGKDSKVADREKLSGALADYKESANILKDLDHYEKKINETPDPKWGFFSELTTSPTFLNKVGYGKRETLEELRNMDKKINTALEMMIDTDKTLDKETRTNAKQLMSLSNTGVSKDILRKKIDMVKRFMGKKYTVAAGTLGTDTELPSSFDAPSSMDRSPLSQSLNKINDERATLANNMNALKMQYGF